MPLRNLILGQNAQSSLQIQSAKVAASFAGEINPQGSVVGRLDLDMPSLAGFITWLGIDGGSSIQRFKYTGDVNASSDQFSTNNARVTLDDTTISGSASVRFGNKTIIKANLASALLDLEKLGTSNSGQGSSGTSSQNESGASEIDLSALKDLEGDIRIDARQVRYGDVEAGPVRTDIMLKNSVANIQIPEAGFYGGSMVAGLTLNGSGAIPTIVTKLNLTNLNALQLLNDASGLNRIEGRLNAAIDVSATGKNTDAMIRALAGRADVRFSDGAIRGIDMAKLIQNIQTVMVTGYREDASERTEFTELASTFDIQDGVANTQNLRLLGPLVRMDGSGNVDIANQTIDMRLNPRVVGSLSGQGGDFDVSGLEIPLIVRAPLEKPKVYPDLTAILQNPEATLRSLSKLKGIEKIAKDALNPEAVINRELEKITGTGDSDLVGGLLKNLGNNQSESSTGPSESDPAKSLIGSLLQGALNNGNQPEQNLQDTPSVNGSNIPIPTRNPRKPANGQNLVQQPPADPAKQVLEEVLRKNLDENTNNLFQGILGGSGN